MWPLSQQAWEVGCKIILNLFVECFCEGYEFVSIILRYAIHATILKSILLYATSIQVA